LFETVHLECHQQRFFTLKMHQNVGGWGFSPDPTVGPLAGLRGLFLRGGEANRRKGEVTEGKLWTLTMLETD